MPKQTVTFALTPEHVRLAEKLSFQVLPDMGWDTPGRLSIFPAVNQKRPFGNSGIVQQAAEILKLVYPGQTPNFRTRQKAMSVMAGVPVALEIMMTNKTFEPGKYEIQRYGAWFSYREAMMAVFWLRAIEACFKLKDANGDDLSDRAYDFARAHRCRNPYRLLAELEKWAQSAGESSAASAMLGAFESAAVEDYRALHPKSKLGDAALLVRLKAHGDPNNGLWPFWDEAGH